MKKNIKYIILLFVFVLILAACGKKGSSDKVSESSPASDKKSSLDSNGSDSASDTENAMPTVVPIEENELPDEESSTEDTENSDIDIDDPRIDEILSKLSKEEKIYQLFIVTPEQLAGVNIVTRAGGMTKTSFNNKPVGGLIYFAKNFENAAQIKEMTKNMQAYSEARIDLPIFLGIDEEGGTVSRVVESGRVAVTNVGNMSDIGATGDANKAYEAGNTIGKYLNELGFNLDFAPVADVLTNAENQSLKLRSFGSDANLVSDMCVSFAKALNENKIIACYKHFPGLGAAKEDTHQGMAVIDKKLDELKATELKPFEAAVNNGAQFIMVGHVTLPNVTKEDVPASLSSEVIDILRKDYSYDGIVLTDSLSMKAVTDKYGADTSAVMAFKAGADMILLPADFQKAYTGLLNAVNNGEISEERLNQSVKRILKIKLAMKDEE